MKRCMLWAMLAMAAIAVALLPSTATAAEGVPFAAQFTTTVHGTHDGRVDVFTGTGTGTRVGSFTLVVKNHFLDMKRLVSEITITAQDGDELDIYTEQTWDAATNTWSGDFTFTGGTGRFLNASGGGRIDVVLDFATETAAAVLIGKISF